jgi:peptidoglycan/LPS O-acetylase OafA/YrhL
MGNLWPLFYGFEPRGALGHTWSLGIEEQFYMLWPLILVAAPIAFAAPRRFAVWVAAVTAFSVVFARLVVVGVLHYPHWKSIPFFDFAGLALGCLLAIVLHTDTAGRFARVPPWLLFMAATIVLFDLFAARFYVDHDTYDLRSIVLRSCFVVIVAACVLQPQQRIAAPLRTVAMVWLGKLSYSLYLWHVPIFTIFSPERMPGHSRFVLVPVKVALAFGAAIASYFLIEQPAIRYGKRLRERRRVRSLQGPPPPVAGAAR